MLIREAQDVRFRVAAEPNQPRFAATSTGQPRVISRRRVSLTDLYQSPDFATRQTGR